MNRVCPAVLLLATACRPPGSSTGPGPGDANFVLDGGCVIVGYNCDQVGSCSSDCGSDQACVDACQGAACDSANSAFEAIRSCTIQNCWSRCLGGDTPECSACSADKCAADSQACDVNQCPITCATPDGGPPDAAVPPRDGGSAQKSCQQIYACMGMCLVETPFLCIGFCKGRGCTSAQDALDALLQCAETQCRSATDERCKDRYSTDECQACMEQRCTTAWSACTANGC